MLLRASTSASSPQHTSEQAGPLEEMSRILDQPPMPIAEALRGDTMLTRRWQHGEVHDRLPPLPAHVVVAHHGGDAEINLRSGDGLRLTGHTRSGTILIIPKGHDGRWDITGRPDVSHVYLTEERLQSSVAQLTDGRTIELLDRVGFEDPTSARILGVLCDEATVTDQSTRLFLEHAVDLLCIQLARSHSSFRALPDRGPRRGLAEWQVNRVTKYMRSMMEQDIGLDELAALVNLSRYHFCRAFHSATGRTPYEWLTGIRMSRAKELLADQNLSVTEIAFCVGYQSPSSFTATFRKVVGITPTEYRRRL
jgi:AraC family transcriptional regulator